LSEKFLNGTAHQHTRGQSLTTQLIETNYTCKRSMEKQLYFATMSVTLGLYDKLITAACAVQMCDAKISKLYRTINVILIDL